MNATRSPPLAVVAVPPGPYEQHITGAYLDPALRGQCLVELGCLNHVARR